MTPRSALFPLAAGTPFAALGASWPSVGKLHLAVTPPAGSHRIRAVCGRTFRDVAETYEVGTWERMAPPPFYPDETRCQACVRRSVANA